MAQDPYKYFRPEAHEILEKFSRGIVDLEKGEGVGATIQHLLRLAHTLKGAARVVKQSEIANRAHAIEDALLPLRHSSGHISREQIDTVLGHLDAIGGQLDSLTPAAEPAASAAGKAVVEEAPRTIRAELAEADAILDSVVETHALTNGLRTAVQSIQQVTRQADLLVSQSSIIAAEAYDRQAGARSGRRIAIAEELRRKLADVERNLASLVDQIDRELRQLREAAERLRLVPTGNLFTTLERMARDTARALSKQVTFRGTGGEIRLDARVLDTVQGALVQIIRNAVAHGIEASDERARAGKSAVGAVSLAISRRDRRIVFLADLKPLHVHGRSYPADSPIRAIAERRLVYDAVVNLRLNPLLAAPVLRKDVMDIDIFVEDDGLIECLAGPKVLRALLHEESMDAFIGCRKTAAHALKAIRPKHAVSHGRRLRPAGKPTRHLDDVFGETRFYRRAVKLSKNAAPIPASQFAFVLSVLPFVPDLPQDRG